MRALIFALFLPGVALGQAADDELGEAKGLDEKAPAQEPAPTEHARHVRGYGVYEQRFAPKLAGKKGMESYPDVEVGLTTDTQVTDSTQAFIEGRAGYDDETQKGAAVFDQGGLRWRPSDETVLAVGKERNRRAPGLIVSPSDFINSNEHLPGQRQERGGVWLLRGSYQTIAQSVDLIVLPVNRMNAQGMPDPESRYEGGALRWFRQFDNLDVGLSAGRVNDSQRAGLSVQGLVQKVWKVYEESGSNEKSQIGPFKREKSYSHLVGLSYEGSDDFSAHVEYFRNGGGLTAKERRRVGALYQTLPLADQQYLISSLAFPEIRDRYNVTDTYIKSLDAETWLNALRLEWLATDRQVLGFTHVRSAHTWQASADWTANL